MPEEGWTMQDGTPWPGNNPRDHPGMIQVYLMLLIEQQHLHRFMPFINDVSYLLGKQVFLGNSGGLDVDGNELPRLVYVSREKRPGFQHHKKAGAMNALVCICFLFLCNYACLVHKHVLIICGLICHEFCLPDSCICCLNQRRLSSECGL